MTDILNQLNNITPIGIATLMALIVYSLVKNKGIVTPASQASVDKIANNHLHDLPEAVELIRSIDTRLADANRKLDGLSNDMGYLKGRINGRS